MSDTATMSDALTRSLRATSISSVAAGDGTSPTPRSAEERRALKDVTVVAIATLATRIASMQPINDRRCLAMKPAAECGPTERSMDELAAGHRARLLSGDFPKSVLLPIPAALPEWEAQDYVVVLDHGIKSDGLAEIYGKPIIAMWPVTSGGIEAVLKHRDGRTPADIEAVLKHPLGHALLHLWVRSDGHLYRGCNHVHTTAKRTATMIARWMRLFFSSEHMGRAWNNKDTTRGIAEWAHFRFADLFESTCRHSGSGVIGRGRPCVVMLMPHEGKAITVQRVAGRVDLFLAQGVERLVEQSGGTRAGWERLAAESAAQGDAVIAAARCKAPGCTLWAGHRTTRRADGHGVWWPGEQDARLAGGLEKLAADRSKISADRLSDSVLTADKQRVSDARVGDHEARGIDAAVI